MFDIGAALETGGRVADPGAGVRLLLDDNPFSCDCDLYPLVRALRSPAPALLRTLGLHLEVGAASCATPAALRSKPLASVEPAHLACSVPSPPCPLSCECRARPADATLFARCDRTSSWSEVPAPDALGLSRLELALVSPQPQQRRSLRLDWRDVPPGLAAVDLSRSGVVEIEVSPAIPDTLLVSAVLVKLASMRSRPMSKSSISAERRPERERDIASGRGDRTSAAEWNATCRPLREPARVRLRVGAGPCAATGASFAGENVRTARRSPHSSLVTVPLQDQNQQFVFQIRSRRSTNFPISYRVRIRFVKLSNGMNNF